MVHSNIALLSMSIKLTDALAIIIGYSLFSVLECIVVCLLTL